MVLQAALFQYTCNKSHITEPVESIALPQAPLRKSQDNAKIV